MSGAVPSVTVSARIPTYLAHEVQARAAQNGTTVSEEIRGALDLRLARTLVAQRDTAAYRRCPYCGTPCYGATCRAHRDLPALEQHRGAE